MPGKIILGIPGPWKNRADLIASILRANADSKNPRYLGLGSLISDLQTKESFGFEIYEHEPRLADAFKGAGQGRFSKELLAAIGKHTYTIYVANKVWTLPEACSAWQPSCSTPEGWPSRWKRLVLLTPRTVGATWPRTTASWLSTTRM
jgi:hypothetical protein